jgi:chromosome partitioning protein
MRTIAIINQKGGCGKTTTAINLSSMLARRGKRTLLIDLDPQSHCAAGLNIPESRLDLDITDALLAVGTRTLDPARLLWRAARNLDLAPSRMRLAGLEAPRGPLADAPDKETRLATVVRALEAQYDVVCIDCPPSIGLLTYNALVAATMILIPVETGFFSLQGATKQVNTVRTLSRRLKTHPPVWLVPTIHEAGNSVAEDLLAELHRRFKGQIAPLVIHRDSKLREAASFGQAIADYAPESVGAADYAALAKWIESEVATTVETKPEHTGADEDHEQIPEITSPHRRATAAIDDLALARALQAATPANQSNGAGQTGHPTPTDQTRYAHPTAQPVSHAAAHNPGQPLGQPEPVSTSIATSQPAFRAATTGSQPLAGQTLDLPPEVADALKIRGMSTMSDGQEPKPITRAEDVARRAQDFLRRIAIGRGQTQAQSQSQAQSHTQTLATTTLESPDAIQGDLSSTLASPHIPTMPAATLKIVEAMSPVTPPPSIHRIFGVRRTAAGVLFVQPMSLGRTVSVAGSFNDWSATEHVLRPNVDLGVFELCLPLSAGRHLYRVVVDGEWITDPYNDATEPNGLGGTNCVIDVR